MSTSTVSISPSPAAASRRRAVEKKAAAAEVDALLSTPPTISDTNLRIETQNRIENRVENRDAVVKKPSHNAAEPIPISNRKIPGRKAVKPPKPKWITITRVLTKNLVLLLVLGGLIQILRKFMDSKAATSSGEGIIVVPADFEGKFAEMDDFMKKTSKMMQVQVDVIDRKLDKHIKSVSEEFERRDVRVDKRFSEVREQLEREFGGKVEKLLSKEEFEKFVEEYSKGKGRDGGSERVSLDDVRVFAKEVVEKEIENHAADGLGRVDYALGSGGARVLKHSDAYYRTAGEGLSTILGRNWVHPDSVKMLTPSFGEPGKCFALKGSSGYVTIRLRTAVVPEAITVEHVAKSVAYDRSSAPKDCRVSGWLAQAEDLTDVGAENEKMFLLSEFTYDLEKSNAQTFKVLDSVGSTVDTIRFDYLSNHGSSSHTCIYRLRVHGHEPSLSMLATEP